MSRNRKSRISLLYSSLDLVLIGVLVYDFGFKADTYAQFERSLVLLGLSVLLIGFNFLRRVLHHMDYHKVMLLTYNSVLGTTLLTAFTSLLIYDFDFIIALSKINILLEVEVSIYFIFRLLRLIRKLYKSYHNPAILFIGSFALIAFVGALLLMLPKATTNGITFTDALFTSTSAVCVTGLIVLDTAKDFTQLGQMIILIIIQLGGIGILTFTSFFAYFFKSGSSFKEGLFIKDYVGSDGLSDVLHTAMRIVIFTLVVELMGAFFIFFSIQHNTDIGNKIFFSIFHSISAFCNAGFSLFSQGLESPIISHTYGFQWIIMILIIFGGLGYGIVENTLLYLKETLKNIFIFRRWVSPVRTLTLNTQIITITTLILLLVGTGFILLADQDTVLSLHDSWWGKFTTAAFTSVTTRTAGFNTINFAELAPPSILFCIFLMWVGASPGSTGGGIKTSTFAIAMMNIVSIAKGKEYIEIGTRKISNDSVRRAFAIILLSLTTICIAILILHFFEREFNLTQLSFEVFSAYSTVGLTLGITPDLSLGGKYIIIAVMFLGRIGTINLLIGLIPQEEITLHQYPEEKILIN